MNRKTLLLAVNVVVLFVWLSVSARFAWGREFLTLKLQGALPETTWLEVAEQMLYSGIGIPGHGFETRVIVNPFDSPEHAAAGQELFQSNCGQCHGSDGFDGAVPVAPDGRFRWGASDGALYRTISRGLAGGMPGFNGSEKEIWQLASFVRTLGSSHAVPQGEDSPPGSDDCPGCEASPVSFERIVQSEAEPGNWLTYSGSYQSQRHSRLDQINSGNVEKLRMRWAVQLRTLSKVQATPLVVDGRMFVTSPPNDVVSIDIRTGRKTWTYERPRVKGLSLCCGRVNRGVALLGERVYVGTLDGHLVALDAASGEELWDVEVADHSLGYTITAAPLAVKDKVVIGVSGGEYGIRGFLDAYDAESGKRAWRFYTIPGPQQPGHETWTGDSWKTGGGATWLTGSFDPGLNLLYWGVGNPGPDLNGLSRQGDNLYSNSVIALDADSGELRWYFQFTPHGLHDWDANQIPVLVDQEYQGRPRKLMLWANRNAFFYLLDRESGEFLSATEFVRQTWAEGIDAQGRPKRLPNTEPTPEGTLVYPGHWGATNWWSPSYSPSAGLFYVPFWDDSDIYVQRSAEYTPGRSFLGGLWRDSGDPGQGGIRALVPESGELAWEYRFPSKAHTGLLSTAGNLVFAGSQEGYFFAIDARSGVELWRQPLGAPVNAAPISYAADGKQQVAIAAGNSVFAFELME